jgi:GNAT superfamily N-acetyltransferase
MLNIRPHREDDLPTLRALVAELHDAVRAYDPASPPSTQIIDAHFDHLLVACARLSGSFFIAERGACTEGYACVLGAVPCAEPNLKPMCYSLLSDLYVRPGKRREGVGRRLVEHVEHYARSLGSSRLVLKVFGENQGALRFYERLGYRRQVLELTKVLG